MFNKLNSHFLLLVMAMFAVSCSSSKHAHSDSGDIDNSLISEELILVPDSFVLPDMPEELTDSDSRARYLVSHYWDRFDFSNESLIEKPEITEQAFVDYINILYYVSFDEVKESLKSTMKQAEVNAEMYNHFAFLFDKYLYEPDSPFRNDNFYIPVLEEIAKSPLLKVEDKERYSFQLQMSKKNRVGQAANDFTYTLASGESQKLSSLKSEYTILMFSDPDCGTCAQATRMLAESEVINKALLLNSPSRVMLTILTVYPDDDVEGWKASLSAQPANWIHSYDKDMKIAVNKLYNIKAFPTLYLLDKNKKVILKDTTIDTLESFFEIP